MTELILAVVWVATLFGGLVLGMQANESSWIRDIEAMGTHRVTDGGVYDCKLRTTTGQQP